VPFVRKVSDPVTSVGALKKQMLFRHTEFGLQSAVVLQEVVPYLPTSAPLVNIVCTGKGHLLITVKFRCEAIVNFESAQPCAKT